MRVQDNSNHHQNCGRVLLAKIRTKIRYGTNDENSQIRAMIFTWVAFSAVSFSMWTRGIISGCHYSLEQNNMSNGTLLELRNWCHFSYERCLCDTLPNITHASKNCITDLHLQTSRIMPLISYVTQWLALRELFSLSAECNRGLLHLAWTASLFILIGSGVGIYWSNCSYSIIMLCIFFTNCPLPFLWFRDLTRERAPRHRYAPGDIILAPRRLQPIGNHVRPPHELV